VTVPARLVALVMLGAMALGVVAGLQVFGFLTGG
jgi:hypothetical protein